MIEELAYQAVSKPICCLVFKHGVIEALGEKREVYNHTVAINNTSQLKECLGILDTFKENIERLASKCNEL